MFPKWSHEASPGPPKRAITILRDSSRAAAKDASNDQLKAEKNEFSYPYKKLKDALFPAAVSALPHVLEAINDLAMSPEEVTIEAIQNGRWNRYDELKTKFGTAGLEKTMHLLLDGIGRRRSISQWKRQETFKAAWNVLEIAADNGHLAVVKFAVKHAKVNRYWSWYDPCHDSNALTRASSGGHLSVVEFLLEDQENVWNIAKAFDTDARRTTCSEDALRFFSAKGW
ncbi:Ankyrin repeat-containing domain [Phytophthora cactorum]|nr:Ankyrin repeat-containing domain [Phytophthora cactorum]